MVRKPVDQQASTPVDDQAWRLARAKSRHMDLADIL